MIQENNYKKYFPDENNMYEDISVDPEEQRKLIEKIKKQEKLQEYGRDELSRISGYENLTTGAKRIYGTLLLKKTNEDLRFKEVKFEAIIHEKRVMLDRCDVGWDYDFGKVFTPEEIGKFSYSLRARHIDTKYFGEPDSIVWISLNPEIDMGRYIGYYRAHNVNAKKLTRDAIAIMDKYKELFVDKKYVVCQSVYGCRFYAQMKITSLKNFSSAAVYMDIHGQQLSYTYWIKLKGSFDLEEIRKNLIRNGFKNIKKTVKKEWKKTYSLDDEEVGIAAAKRINDRFMVSAETYGVPRKKARLEAKVEPVDVYKGLNLPKRQQPDEEECRKAIQASEDFLKAKVRESGIQLPKNNVFFKECKKDSDNLRMYRDEKTVTLPILKKKIWPRRRVHCDDFLYSYSTKDTRLCIKEKTLFFSKMMQEKYFGVIIGKHIAFAMLTTWNTDAEAAYYELKKHSDLYTATKYSVVQKNAYISSFMGGLTVFGDCQSRLLRRLSMNLNEFEDVEKKTEYKLNPLPSIAAESFSDKVQSLIDSFLRMKPTIHYKGDEGYDMIASRFTLRELILRLFRKLRNK